MSPVAIGVGGFSRGKKPAASGGTFTINPSTQAGYIQSAGNTLDPGPPTYSDVRAGSPPATLTSSPGTAMLVGQFYAFSTGDTYTPSNETWYCFEIFLDFDVSVITGTVSSAVLSLGLNNDGSATDFTAEARTSDWGATLTTADYVPGASLSGQTLLATLSSSGIGATGAYKAFTESGTALRNAVTAAKAGSGFLRMVVCSDRHRLNTSPSQDESLNFHAYNHATLKPRLVVGTT